MCKAWVLVMDYVEQMGAKYGMTKGKSERDRENDYFVKKCWKKAKEKY